VITHDGRTYLEERKYAINVLTKANGSLIYPIRKLDNGYTVLRQELFSRFQILEHKHVHMYVGAINFQLIYLKISI
jgi:hypothetical protein